MLPTANTIDIAIIQAVLLREDVLQTLACDGGGFVHQVRNNNRLWPQWVALEPEAVSRLRGFEPGTLLRSLAFARKFDCALCERVHNYQKASDVGLDAFWTDPAQPNIRLLERSYSMLATDFGQFVLVICLRFEGGNPVSRTDMLRRICVNRAIRTNTAQEGFSQLALQYVDIEVNRIVSLLPQGSTASDAKVVASPTVHTRDDWITHVEDLTAYPWILTGKLMRGITDIISPEEFLEPSKKYQTPQVGKPCCIVGHDFGFYSEADESRMMRLELMPVLVHTQAIYYTTRQLQNKMVADMRALHTNLDNSCLELEAEQFPRLSLYFNRLLLGHNHFCGSQIPKVAAVAKAISEAWNIEMSQDRLAQAIAHHQEYLRSQNEERAHRDARRQELILFVIAILQVFTLVSVFADYRQLNPALGDLKVDAVQWGFERWLFIWAPWLLRALACLALILSLCHFTPSVLRRFKQSRRKERRRLTFDSSPVKKPKFGSSGFRVETSKLHGLGLWTTREFVEGQTMLAISGGEKVALAPNTCREYSEDEWNVTPGFLHVRKGIGTAYRWINHSRSPNAIVKYDAQEDKFYIIALRTILPQQEILVDYRKEPLPREYIVERGGYL